ncbi:Transmembrane protein 53 [Grifola frondosa]|uniref:Transmembrane protein 53 n=1 Tax=Grifola frondosa TaxID=5627 RepID=A0A1C7MHH2_GRIFR|nr:Transmembrane protein 53 [Grifola frondosa]
MSSTSTANRTQLIPVNSNVLLASTPEGSEKRNPLHPSVILLFGWLGAQLPHLLKYVDSLRAVFSTSTIVVIKSSTSYYITSQTQLESLLEPVVDIIRHENGVSPSRGVLIHVLSNSGGFHFVTLRNALKKMSISDNDSRTLSFPSTALILDSVPGDNLLKSTISSLVPSKPILRLFAVPPMAMLYAAFLVAHCFIGGNPHIFRELRTTLNSPNLLPSVTHPTDVKATPRLYVYSTADEVTSARKVAKHAEEGRAKGFDVAVEKYATSPHVSHARNDPERYWGAVTRLWERAIAVSKGLPQVSSRL